MSIPKDMQITEDQILSRCGATNVSRGRAYNRQGAVVERIRTGKTIKAKCYGSLPTPYRLTAKLADQSVVDATCSCPVGGGGSCKHVAALLFTWMQEPGSFSELEALTDLLSSRSQESLVQLIIQMVERNPDLEDLIRLPPPQEARKSLDAEIVVRQMRRILEDSDWEYGDEYETANDIEEVIQQGVPYLEAGNIANAVTVFATCAQEVIDNYDNVYDHDGEVANTLDVCGEYLVDCLGETADPSLRGLILRNLFDIHMWDVDFGGIDVGYGAKIALIEQTTPEERAVVIEWVQERIHAPQPDSVSDWRRQILGHFLLELSADEMDDEQFLAICRQSGRYQDLIHKLLELKRVEEAVEAARPLSGFELLQVADDFVKQDHPQEIEALAFAHITGSEHIDQRLVTWLVAHLRQTGRAQEALDLALQRYGWQQNLQSFIAVQEVAEDLGLRAETTQKMCATLEEAKAYGLLVEVYIHEKKIDLALANYERARNVGNRGFRFRFTPLALQLARAAEESHPGHAVQLYVEEAETEIAHRSRDNYATAATYLARTKSLYARMGTPEKWAETVQRIRAAHKNLPAMKDEFNRAGLP